MFETFKMVLMDYREVVYLVFALGAIWGAGISIGIKMAIDERKEIRKARINRES